MSSGRSTATGTRHVPERRQRVAGEQRRYACADCARRNRGVVNRASIGTWFGPV